MRGVLWGRIKTGRITGCNGAMRQNRPSTTWPPSPSPGGPGTGTNGRSSATPLSKDAAGVWGSIRYPAMTESPMNERVSTKLDGAGRPASDPGADHDDPAVPDLAGIEGSATRLSGVSEAGRPVQRGRGRGVLETRGERGERDRRQGQGGPMRQDGFHGMKTRRVRCAQSIPRLRGKLPDFGPSRIRRSTARVVTSTSPRPS